jgi:aspartate-semialdehyde dehydrogenase
MNVGIVGATGQVGTMMRRILVERGFPVDSLRLFASARSAGSSLEFEGQRIIVEDAATASFRGLDVVLFSAGASTSEELAPKVAEDGAIVIDNSSAWRMDPDVPLVVPEVNAETLRNVPKRIIANPNCTTMIVMSPLAGLAGRFGLRRIIASTYQAVSGAGGAGVRELQDQLTALESRASELAFYSTAAESLRPSVFPQVIAANVIPMAGSWVDDETSEEKKFRNESRKILGLPELLVSVTCVRVPVFTGHSISLTVDLGASFDLDEARHLIHQAYGMSPADIPTPIECVGKDVSLVGRVRRDDCFEHGLSFFVAGDNLRKGAALNAVQIAEELNRQFAEV